MAEEAKAEAPKSSNTATKPSNNNFNGIVSHLSSAADCCNDETSVKKALGPNEQHVTRDSVVRDVLNGFLAKLGGATGGVNFITLAKIAAIAIQDWAAGKTVEQIIADVVAAFTAGTL